MQVVIVKTLDLAIVVATALACTVDAMPQKRQSSAMPFQMMPILAAFHVVTAVPSKKRRTGHGQEEIASSGTPAVSSSCGIPSLPFTPRGDLVDQSRQVSNIDKPVQPEDDEVGKAFKKISNYSLFDFLPLAAFGRQGFGHV